MIMIKLCTEFTTLIARKFKSTTDSYKQQINSHEGICADISTNTHHVSSSAFNKKNLIFRILYYTSWAARRCPGLYTLKYRVYAHPHPPPPRCTPKIFNPSTTCPGSSLTYLQSFNSVSWKLCECIETDRQRQRQTDRQRDNPLYRYR